MRFTVDVPGDEQLQAIYNQLYSEGSAYQMHLDEIQRIEDTGRNTAGGHYRSRIFLDRHRPHPGDRLLEIGCGVGTFLMLAQDRGWEVEGIDLSDAAVRASRRVHDLPIRIGSFLDLGFEERTYRAIVAWEVLEHVANPRAFLEKARSLLEPDGVLVCSVPNEGKKVPYPAARGPASVPPVHLNFWDRDALRRFFEVNRFRILRILTQRTMLAIADPRADPLRFARLQAGALIGAREGIHLFAAATPVT